VSDDCASSYDSARSDADAGEDRDSCADPGACTDFHRLRLQVARASLGRPELVGVGEQQYLLAEADAIANLYGRVDVEPAAYVKPATASDVQVALHVTAAGERWLAVEDRPGADPDPCPTQESRPDSPAYFVG
jgi:hypothetical protein